jgi:type IV pilus assembly protein PilF
MRRAATVSLAALLCLSACVSNRLAPGKTPAAAASVNVQLAIEYMRLDKLAIARDFIERALQQDPNDASVQSTAGIIYERLDDQPKAERAFAAAARLGKKDPNILNSYAGFLCRTHKPGEGEKLFLKVAHDPLYQTPEVALVNAGVCVRSAGDNISAERYFRQALSLRPKMPEALLQLGELLFDRDDPQGAVDMVQLYLGTNPPAPEILWLGLRAERKRGDETAASAYAQRLQKEFPASDQARLLQSGLTR